MDVNKKTEVLMNAVQNEQWDVVASHLETFLLDISPVHIDLIRNEGNATLALWLKILLNSNLHADNGNGEILTKSIILKFWDNATLKNKWDLLIRLILLHDINLNFDNNKENIVQCFETINKKTGINVKDIAGLFVWKSSHSMSNIVVNDSSIH